MRHKIALAFVIFGFIIWLGVGVFVEVSGGRFPWVTVLGVVIGVAAGMAVGRNKHRRQ